MAHQTYGWIDLENQDTDDKKKKDDEDDEDDEDDDDEEEDAWSIVIASGLDYGDLMLGGKEFGVQKLVISECTQFYLLQFLSICNHDSVPLLANKKDNLVPFSILFQ